MSSPLRMPFVAIACSLVPLGSVCAAEIAVPMARDLVSVKIRVGLRDPASTVWEGTYRITKGTIVATDGWRFAGDDYATREGFRLEIREFYPLFFAREKGNVAPEANGFILTIAGATPESRLEVATKRGEFGVPLGDLAYGDAKLFLGGSVEVERVPTSRVVAAAPTEDAYPAAALRPDGSLAVAYIAFAHGKGFEGRTAVQTEPREFAYLAAPPGGDRVMFTEMRDGGWSAPAPITDPGGDVFGTALAVDGEGRTWVFWSAHAGGNWDVYARARRGDAWSDPIRLSSDPGPDIHHAAATDASGRVWVAWQGFRAGHSDIFAARQDGDRFGEASRVGEGPANEWTPAIAASSDGRVAIAWDSYERGDYDVLIRIWRNGTWTAPRLAAGTRRNELRPSLAYDKRGRLWIAYEDSPEGWGKDFGALDESPLRVPLYRQRRVGIKVLDREAFHRPAADINLAMPTPQGMRRGPKAGAAAVLASGPAIAVDAVGRVWVAARIPMRRFVSMGAGSTWVSFVTSLAAGGWSPATFVPETDGWLHESPALVAPSGGGLSIVSASDGRFRSAVFHGPQAAKLRRRSPDAPPATTRAYAGPGHPAYGLAAYPDPWGNWEIALADTGPLAAPGEPKLVETPEDPPHAPSAEAQREAENISAVRAYRAEVGGRPLRILRGEFHRHTEISSDGGGDGSILDMWRYGLDLASMDWLGNGDHDNGSREFAWWITQKTTDVYRVPGTFAPVFSYERSCNYPDGHRNPVFARRGVRPLPRLQGGMGKAMDALPPDAPRPHTPDTQMLYRYLGELDGICASHTSGTDMGTDWRDGDPRVEPVVEIYQGCRQSYERPEAPRSNTADYSIGGWRPYGFVSLALKKGMRIGFQSSSDHGSTHISYCCVYVEEPTREAIVEAMRKRHVYGATDNIIAETRCGEHFMGDEFEVASPPTIKVRLIGTAPFARVVIVKDDVYVHSIEPKTRTVEFQWTDGDAKPGKTSYYYVRGEQAGEQATRKRRSDSKGGREVEIASNDGELVWVSPMWITYKP